MKTLRKHRTIALASLAILAIAAMGGAYALVSPTAPVAAQSTARSVAVEVTAVVPASLTETVSSVGTVEPLRDVTVSSETAGRITRVPVKVGDAVRAGQTLAEVDNELRAIAVEQAKAQMLAAETSFGKARKDFERTEKLYATGDVADVELESYRLAMQSAEAQYQGARAALKQAQRALEDTRIKAPISGLIASRNVEVGEMLGPGMPVANIVDLSALKIRLSIPEEDITRLTLQQTASVRIDSRPDVTYSGKVHTIGSKTESPTGHTYPVEILVEKKASEVLKAGMFARVDVRTGVATDALVISKESLLGDGDAASVYVVEGGVARLRPVKVGIRAGERVQVLGGLRAGDLVVSFGQKNITDGSPVKYETTGR